MDKRSQKKISRAALFFGQVMIALREKEIDEREAMESIPLPTNPGRKVLMHFLKNPGRVITREELYQLITGNILNSKKKLFTVYEAVRDARIILNLGGIPGFIEARWNEGYKYHEI